MNQKPSMEEQIIYYSNVKMNEMARESIKTNLINSLSMKQNTSNNKSALLAVATLTAIAAIGMYVFYSGAHTSKTAEYYDMVSNVGTPIVTEPDSSSTSMKIAVVEYGSLSEAVKFLAYTPFKIPKIEGYNLISVQTEKRFDESPAESLMLTFSNAKDSILRITQMRMASENFFPPDGVTSQTVTINGKEFTIYVGADEEIEGAISYDGNSDRKDFVTVYTQGIYMEVANLGGLSTEETVSIMKSILQAN